ncbi:MAG: type II toxin-antitoxin system RelE family toxin [Syntrophobacteraceae bacterium]
MRVRFHNRAVKFLDKIDGKDKERLRLKIGLLVGAIEEQGVIPFKELDIKRLEGEWEGFLRMRFGKMRVIFRIDKEENVLIVYDINYRGDVYK